MVGLLLSYLEVYLLLFLMIDEWLLIDIRIILIGLISNPLGGYLFQCLPLEIELRFCVNNLINQFQIGYIQEVRIGLMSRGYRKNLSIEFALNDRSHIVIWSSVTFKFRHFSSLELLLQACIVHLVGDLQELLYFLSLFLETSVEWTLTRLHSL